MHVEAVSLSGVLLIEPRVFSDERGLFTETYQAQRYGAAGVDGPFVQDNFSRSQQNVLRGLHYQITQPQGKLVSVVRGSIYDVVVDLRNASPTLGQWFGLELTAESRRQIYVPPGFAHGFCALEPETEVAYKCTTYYAPEYERTIVWNDPELGIAWPTSSPLLSPKDAAGLSFAAAPKFA
ncbi:dTDP-4-dehydrorhamnose 3,5-epimerase [Lignipirellula cremea]|uniref:dTDP-4-dehydrorhamnose 3,5-epimerase n=1 Tax=Lignipirellula cremea TaxID=2528010 RepID=A0A518DS31_9BACT|nr:dTDP-4-dehydrorhamnose 3,5-epimerase [Lignipirellula cremea]QDU94634.1 dTDP-4-dehydrorhamnose 3,5-epimerase [Lignipirellula cremea]